MRQRNLSLSRPQPGKRGRIFFKTLIYFRISLNTPADMAGDLISKRFKIYYHLSIAL